jgi:NAD-dependent dihydropyrimidine dehydrogenase PreA subunit
MIIYSLVFYAYHWPHNHDNHSLSIKKVYYGCVRNKCGPIIKHCDRNVFTAPHNLQWPVKSVFHVLHKFPIPVPYAHVRKTGGTADHDLSCTEIYEGLGISP